MEILANALPTREHRLDNRLACVIELFILELHQDDGDAALALGRHIGSGIAAHGIEPAISGWQPIGLELHLQGAKLCLNKCILGSRALVGFMGANGSQSRQRRGVVIIPVTTSGNSQAVGGQESIVKGVTHSLNLEGSAITLGDCVPAGLGWNSGSHNSTAEQYRQNKILFLHSK